MSDGRRRTVRHVTVVVETEGLSEKEHERRVTWVEKNIEDAGRKIDTAFCSMVIRDEAQELVGYFGSGSTSREELEELANRMVADARGS